MRIYTVEMPMANVFFLWVKFFSAVKKFRTRTILCVPQPVISISPTKAFHLRNLFKTNVNYHFLYTVFQALPDMNRPNNPMKSLLPSYAQTVLEKVVGFIQERWSFSGMILYIYALDECLVIRKTGLVISDERNEHAFVGS